MPIDDLTALGQCISDQCRKAHDHQHTVYNSRMFRTKWVERLRKGFYL